MSHAASFDSAGMSSHSESGGKFEIRDVMQRQMLLSRLSSSSTPYISWELVTCGSSTDSVLSRTMNMSLEDRDGRKEVRSSGFLMPVPMVLES